MAPQTSDGDRSLDSRQAAVVPAINTASSTAALRSLGRRGISTIAISEDETAPGFDSKYCEETAIVPDPVADLGAYEAALEALARRDDVATILPFRESDVYVLARNRDALSDHVGTPWPDLETLRSVQDRVELFDAADAADVSVPQTRTLDDWDDWDENVIIKPRYTVHAPEYSDRFDRGRVEVGSTRYVSPSESPDRDAIVEEMEHVPLVQEFVPTTDEYGFFALYDHGEPVATFQHRQRRGTKYCGGPSAYRESIRDPALEAAGRRLLDELDWHGVAMVEFLRDPGTGEFKLMEINPRFWSSLPFTVQAGVDFPELFWASATGNPVERSPEYEVGMAGHLLRGEMLHLHSILAEDYPLIDRPSLARRAYEVGVSLLRHPRFDYLDTDDPGPFLRDVRNLVDEFGLEIDLVGTVTGRT